MKNVFKEAHELTKKIIKKGDSYRATFKLALIFVYSQIRKGVKEMVELTGSEKQVKWALDIRTELNKTLDLIKDATISNKTKKNKSSEEAVSKIELVVNVLNSKTDSNYFIENFKDILKKNDRERLFLLRDLISDSTKEFNDIKSLSVYASLAIRETK